MNIIEFKNVTKEYVLGETKLLAVDHINFEIREGEFVVILGPSGAGKSTLLNLLGGMDYASSGDILINGKNITNYKDDELTEYRATKVGFVFQFYNLIPTLTALENVTLTKEVTRNSMDPVKVLASVGLQEHVNLTCKNVLNDTPAQCLRPKAPKSIKHSILDRTRLWTHLSFHSQWNLRDVIRCKGRSSMAIVGILGCSALLICGFGLQDTMDNIVTWNYEVINHYETQLDLMDTITEEQIDKIKQESHGEGVYEGKVELRVKGKKKSGEIMVIEEKTGLIQFVDEKRNIITLPEDRISISYKMAENLGVKVGDEISWHIYGEERWITSHIDAIYRTPFAQGITMYRSFYEELGYTYRPSMIVSEQSNVSDRYTEGRDGIKKIADKEDLIKSYRTLARAMDIGQHTSHAG